MSNSLDSDRGDVETVPSMVSSQDKTRALVLSYLGIRRAIGTLGLLLPVLLGPIGKFALGIPIQNNMSSYYHTPLRDVFVGCMCAIGIFLFCYRGHDWIESWTANLGCLSALGIGLCPLDAGSDPLFQTSKLGYLHSLSGGVFFTTLTVYSLYHFPTARGPNDGDSHEIERNLIYRASGVALMLSMLAMGIYLFLIGGELKRLLNENHFLFWMEWVAVWSFSAAWLTKGRAMIAELAVDLMAIPVDLLRQHEHQ